jgi:RNA polymerase-binding transcription factor DksA
MDAKLHRTLIKRLNEERTRVAGELEELTQSTEAMEQDAVPAGVGTHMAEEANTTVEIEKNLAVKETLSGLLREIDHALENDKKGRYGLCDNCGKDINPDRLDFWPHATLCIDCKGKLERGEIDLRR